MARVGRRQLVAQPNGSLTNGSAADDGSASASTDEIIEATASRLREAGREAVGVGGDSLTSSLRSTLSGAGVGVYPVVALGLLVAVDQLQTTALTILAPEMSAGLGISRSAFTLVILLKTLVLTLAAMPIAAAVQRRARRAAVCIMTAFVWAVLTVATAFVVNLWGLLLVAVLAGAATASVRSVHEPLLIDSYPPAARVRVMSVYRGFNNAGDVAGPIVIALSATALALTWRGALLALGAVALIAAVVASRLRDPGFGRWDTERVRELVRQDQATEGGAGDSPDASLGFFEIARRVFLIPTVRKLLVAHAVLGMFLAPFLTYFSFFLSDRWNMGPGARSALFAALPVFGIVALRLFGRRGEELFRTDPARLLRLGGTFMSVALVLLAAGIFAPSVAVLVVLFGVSSAMLTVMLPAIAMPMYAIVPAEMRPHLGALTGIALTGVGGVAGVLLLGGIDRRFGPAGAILSLIIPGVISGLVLRAASRTVNSDLDRMLDNIVEQEEIVALRARGVHPPLLSCKGLDFAYGQLQVLFDVDFTVDDGEMVALLGTNGAGKSTLLRVVSGIGLPSRGSIRFRGADITYVDAERRVAMGISQVPGGRAVFGPLSVDENLRVLGHTHGRNRRAIEAGIEASFEAFPRLAERRDQLASTLSGGEQQMLGLATAFMLQPRLLVIDELSLGLAPKVVGELLTMVRRINERGTAIVLVEQSVNVALSVVEHAYFMEKGQVRFDGRATDLLDRPDLLRSVFLEGATKGLAGPGSRHPGPG